MGIFNFQGVMRDRRQALTSRGNFTAVQKLALRKPRHLIAVGALLAGVLVPLGGIAVISGQVGATPPLCSAGAVVAGVGGCTSTGTLNLTGGSLQLTAPSSLTWGGTISGLNLSLYDSVAGDQGYVVSDDTGTGAGWHVTLSATTFTNGSHTLANTGTFSTTGSITSATANTAPTAACVASSICSVPTNSTTYPVAVTTAASSPTAVTVYDTAAATGMGAVQIGGSGTANPVGWWLNVPALAYAGSYTSTLTFSVISAP